MVKKSTLMAFTAITISLFFTISAVIISQVPNVSVITVDSQTVTSTVACTGRIEYCSDKTINATQLSQVSEVFVSEGDIIKKGDKLYSAVVHSSDTASSAVKSVNLSEDNEIIKSVLNGDINSLDDYNQDGIAFSVDTSKDNEAVTVYSEYDGIIGEVNIKSGQLISPGDELFKIAKSDSMQARLDVSESKIADIKLGQEAIVSCNALKNSQMKGKVTKIGSVAKQTATAAGKETTIDVIVKIDSGLSDKIKPGYSVKCNITVGSKDNAVILPYEAIKYDDNGKEYVLCYSDNGICEKRQVKTGEEYKNGVEVLSGVDENELVLSSPDGITEQCFAKATEEKND